jgi:hypothetical protein
MEAGVTLAGQDVQDHYDRLFQIISAANGTQVVRTLAMLSVAEHLGSGRLSAEEIAARESSDPSMTYRVLRAGAALGLLEYDADGRVFSGTDMLRLLHRDSPATLKNFAQVTGDPVFWGPAVFLPETVRRGRHYLTETLGCEVFEYFAHHPHVAQLFSAAMTDMSLPVVDAAVAAIRVPEGSKVVDVGGANGALLSALLRRHPSLSGTVLDLPHVMPGVAEEAARWELTDRMTGVAGDFFDSVPAGDVFLLKHVLHDWDDESSIRILSNIRAAMRPGARLAIIEMVIGAESSTIAALLDMTMLYATTGRERELPEYETLLDAAKLRIVRVVPIHRQYHIIEAEAAQP